MLLVEVPGMPAHPAKEALALELGQHHELRLLILEEPIPGFDEDDEPVDAVLGDPDAVVVDALVDRHARAGRIVDRPHHADAVRALDDPAGLVLAEAVVGLGGVDEAGELAHAVGRDRLRPDLDDPLEAAFLEPGAAAALADVDRNVEVAALLETRAASGAEHDRRPPSRADARSRAPVEPPYTVRPFGA